MTQALEGQAKLLFERLEAQDLGSGRLMSPRSLRWVVTLRADHILVRTIGMLFIYDRGPVAMPKISLMIECLSLGTRVLVLEVLVLVLTGTPLKSAR